MLVPKTLYGSSAQARARGKPLLKRALAGKLSGLELIETADIPGELVIERPVFAGLPGDHVRLHAVMTAAEKRPRTDERMHLAFDALVEQPPWGPLCLVSSSMLFAGLDAPRERRLVGALLELWNIYAAEGPRFSAGGAPGALWENAPFLRAIVHKRGID